MNEPGAASASSRPSSRRRRSKTRASRIERTSRILLATAEVVGEYGIVEARISDIAERAGMSPGNVLYYYPTKDDLLLATLEDMEAWVFQSLDDSASASYDTVVDELRDVLLSNAPSGPGDVRFLLWLSVWERASRDERVRKGVSRNNQRWFDRIERLLARAIEQGEVVCDDPSLEALRLIALLDGLGVAVVAATSFIDHERMVEIVDAELARLAP